MPSDSPASFCQISILYADKELTKAMFRAWVNTQASPIWHLFDRLWGMATPIYPGACMGTDLAYLGLARSQLRHPLCLNCAKALDVDTTPSKWLENLKMSPKDGPDMGITWAFGPAPLGVHTCVLGVGLKSREGERTAQSKAMLGGTSPEEMTYSVALKPGLLDMVWDSILYEHMGILPSIPYQTQETRLMDN